MARLTPTPYTKGTLSTLLALLQIQRAERR
jgi:hypothetical protein